MLFAATQAAIAEAGQAVAETTQDAVQRMQPLDLIVFGSYLAVILGIGFFCLRFSKDTEGFMAAGRSMPGWVVGLSIFGIYVSSISFLANPGKSYGADWNPFVFGLSLPIAAFIAVKYFVPYYRKGNSISAYEHLETRFGPWARTYVLACFLLTQLARVGIIMYLVALVLKPLTGWDVWFTISIIGVLVTIYTLVGGIKAVVWNDAIQSVVLSIGLMVSIVIILTGMPEGPGQIFRIASEHDKFSLGSFGASLSDSTFWVVLIYGLFINLQNFGIDQSYVQRYITAKSDREAGKSIWLGAMLYIPISAMLFFIGTGLFAYYQAQPELAAGIQGLNADDIFPHFIATQLPAGIKGLLIAAVFSAAMSSVDASLNSSATLILCDLYKRYFRPQASEKESMRVLHGTTLFWGILATSIALILGFTMKDSKALDVWWVLASIFSGGMLGLFLLGMISRRAGNPQAVIAVITGIFLILWMVWSTSSMWPESLAALKSPFHGNLIIVIATTAILLVGLLLTSLFGGKRPVSEEK